MFDKSSSPPQTCGFKKLINYQACPLSGQHSMPIDLQLNTARAAPAIGAAMYSHKWVKCPDAMAGPMERAGFIEAPVMGPPNKDAIVMVNPMATPAMRPFSFEPDANAVINYAINC